MANNRFILGRIAQFSEVEEAALRNETYAGELTIETPDSTTSYKTLGGVIIWDSNGNGTNYHFIDRDDGDLISIITRDSVTFVTDIKFGNKL